MPIRTVYVETSVWGMVPPDQNPTLRRPILPKRRLDDAQHVACALCHELDALVSWNYRHIANVTKAAAFNAVAALSGIRGRLEIHTPLEILGWK